MVSRRALLGTLLLAGCGFAPVYGPGGAGGLLQDRVRAADPVDAEGFAYNARIAERLGSDAGTEFLLDYRFSMATVAQAITTDEVTTRYSLNGTVDFTLSRIATGEIVTSGRVSNFTSYSTTGTTIATLTAERDAQMRLARMLADQTVTRLLALDPALLS